MSRAEPIIIIPTDQPNPNLEKPKIVPNVQRDRSPPRAGMPATLEEAAQARQQRQKARVSVSDDSDYSADDIECSHSGNSTDDSSESVQEPKKRTETVRAVVHTVADDVRGANDTDEAVTSTHIEVFWATVDKMHWKNKGERMMTNIPALNGNTRTIFHAVYKTIYKSTLEMLEGDGMFERNGISPQNKHVIVSHIIGLGRDTHSTLMLDMEFLQILVNSDECQSLDALLPRDIRQS